MTKLRIRILAALFAAMLAVTVLTTALAYDPGVINGPEPRVPQGPNSVACENQGGAGNPSGKGVFNAIARGGQVHCWDGGDEDGGGHGGGKD